MSELPHLTQLWNKTLQGDRKATEEFYYILFDRLIGFCINRRQDRPTAEDIAGETIERLFNIAQTETIEKPLNWAYTTAARIIISRGRHDKTKQKHTDWYQQTYAEESKNTIEEEMDASKNDEIIKNNLSEPEQQLWKLHCDGYRNPEIAEELNMTVERVGKLKHVIREKIKGFLPPSSLER